MQRAVVALFLIPVLYGHCSEAGAEGPKSVHLFDDLSLSGGFRLSAVESTTTPLEIATVLAARSDTAPQWRLAQWGTQFSLESATEQRRSDGSRELTNAGKTVRVYPGGLGGEGVLLAVQGGTEYGGRLRAFGEPWPHLLVEQTFTKPRKLYEWDRIEFQVEFRVEQCEAATDQKPDPGLHTAHINAFWTIHNLNPDSADHRDMIWFGLPLFDARHEIAPGHQALDIGKNDATGKFICTIDGHRFWSAPVDDGQWHTLACDLLPYIREALAASQAKGFLVNTQFEDLAATTFNLGWEVPGPYNCAIHLRHLQMDGIEKSVQVGKAAKP